MILKNLILGCLMFFIAADSISQGFSVTNFKPSDYQAYNQNWSVAKNSDGVVFVGNNGGLLEYDGTSWKLHPEQNNNTIRSVYVDSDSKIYTGSFEDFGVWEPNEFGQLKYHSLVTADLKEKLHSSEIWGIIRHGKYIYFQTFGRSMFKLKDDGNIDFIAPPSYVLWLSQVNEKLLAFGNAPGVYELKEDEFTLLEGSDILKSTTVQGILPFSSANMLIGTSTEGLYLQENGVIKYWDCECSDVLKTSELNRGLVGEFDTFLFGTIQSGVVICDKTGKVVNIFNKKNGLQNNTILGMMLDRENSILWLALNNGFDKVDLSSPYIKYNHDRKFGAVFTGALFEEFLYLGTNQGVYYKKVGVPTIETVFEEEFQLLEGSQGQVWNMSVEDNQLMVGHNNGTFIISKNEFTKISDNAGGWNLIKYVHQGKEYLLQATYVTLVLFEKGADGIWSKIREFDDFSEPLRFIEVDGNGNIWASHEERGVYKINLSEDLSEISMMKFYGREQGFSSDYNINVFKIKDRVIFTSSGKIFQYDAVMDSVLDYQILNEGLLENEQIRRVAKVADDRYWLMSDEAFMEMVFEQGRLTLEEIHPYNRFGDFIPEKFENVVALNDSLSLFCYPSGFSIYNQKQHTEESSIFGQPLLRGITYDSEPIETKVEKKVIELVHGDYDLTFLVSAPTHRAEIAGFMFKLEGSDREWRPLQTSPSITFSRLPSGDFDLRAKFVDDLGNQGKEFIYPFRIQRPWYYKWYAYLIYSLILGLLYWIFRFLVKESIRIKERKLRVELEREKLRQQRKERESHEKEVLILRNDKLEEEVNHKIKQLAGTAMGTVKKNEVLIKLKEEFSKRKQIFKDEASQSFYKAIFSIIDTNLNDDENWSLFAENFDQAHQNFTIKVKKQFPELTPKEIRFCTYLRMNLSSKEIASLLNIAVGSIEVKRYRLRKKMNLMHDQNLVDFLMAI